MYGIEEMDVGVDWIAGIEENSWIENGMESTIKYISWNGIAR